MLDLPKNDLDILRAPILTSLFSLQGNLDTSSDSLGSLVGGDTSSSDLIQGIIHDPILNFLLLEGLVPSYSS